MTTITVQEATAAVRDAIGAVAPDVAPELDSLDPTIDAFEELQLDSMDHLNIMAALAERTGVAIPEEDYPELRSLDALVRRLTASDGSRP